MQTIWFPAPVGVLLRRLVNVVSSLSLSHQYLAQKSETGDSKTDWSTLKSFGWLSWSNRSAQTKFALAVDGDVPPLEQQHHHNPRSRPNPATNRTLDIIHRLMHSPALYDPVRVPRNPVALCHGAHTSLYSRFCAHFF